MQSVIASPAVRAVPPGESILHLDNNCTANGAYVIDHNGVELTGANSVEIWSNGIANCQLTLDYNPFLEYADCSASICMVCNTATLQTVWELGGEYCLQASSTEYVFSSPEKTLISQKHEGRFTMGVTCTDRTELRLYHNGDLQTQVSRSPNESTENFSVLRIGSDDRLVAFLLYNRVLEDAAMLDIYHAYFETSQGIDHLGYRNHLQSLK